MARAPHQHEDVPDRVAVAQRVPPVKEDADRVSQPTGHDQEQSPQRQRCTHRVREEHPQPAHEQIQRRGRRVEAVRREQLEQESREGNPPHQRKHGPAPALSHEHPGKGRVGARDEQKDGDVVEDAERPLQAGGADTVVEGGGGVEEDQRAPEHRRGGQVPSAARQPRQDEQPDPANQT